MPEYSLTKHRGKLALTFRDAAGKPRRITTGTADWNARFHRDESVEMLRAAVLAQHMFDFNEGSDPEDEHDAECGTWCTGEEA